MASVDMTANVVGEIANPNMADVTGELDPAALIEAARRQQRLDELTTDYERLRRQKARKMGGIEARTLLNLCFVGGSQDVEYRNSTISLREPETGKLNLIFNLIGPRLGKLIGRISAMGGTYRARPDKTDPAAAAEAEVVDRMITALDEKLDQPSKTWQILWWMAVGGTAFVHTPWIPNATLEVVPVTDAEGNVMYDGPDDQRVPEPVVRAMSADPTLAPAADAFAPASEPDYTGEVGDEVYGPLNVFIDQSVRSIEEMSPDQRVYIAVPRTKGWIAENFPDHEPLEAAKDFSIVTSRFGDLGATGGGDYLRDLIPLVQGSLNEGDPDVYVVVSAYGPPSMAEPSGTYDCFIPGRTLLHTGPCPYGEIPVTDFHWKPVTTSFWTDDYITNLIPAQKFINKRLSQLGEQANATLYSSLLLGPGKKPSDVPVDYPGAVENGLNEAGQPMIARLGPPELPAWFMQSTDTVVKIFNDLAGGADLFQESRFPGQLRGPMAVPMLQEILDTEWGPLYMHIGQRTARVKQQRLNRVKQFYPPERTMLFTDRTQREEVIRFHTDKILRAGTNYNVTVDRGSLIPELRALREARVMERLASPMAILYMDERTGALDKSKIAADMAFGDAGRESREATYRKLGKEIVDLIWTGKPTPPVMPFYDHAIMMDELEAAMATMEFLKAEMPIQKAFSDRWEQHRTYMMIEAQAQAAVMQQAAMSSAATAAATGAISSAGQAADPNQSSAAAVKAGAMG